MEAGPIIQQPRIPHLHASNTLTTSPVSSGGQAGADGIKISKPNSGSAKSIVDCEQETSWVVVPEELPEKTWILLSPLDKFILPIYIPVYFIYDTIPADRFNAFVTNLSNSLAKVLVPYYPWAGRLKKNPVTQSWDLHCDNSGTEFRVVHVDEELRKTVFSRPCLELRLLAPRLDAVPREGAPSVAALSVQVTRFKCGAVAVGCSFHHQCGDAHAVSMFMQAWSQLMRNEPLSVIPVHDRSSVVASTTTNSSSSPSPSPPVAIVGTKGAVAIKSSTTSPGAGAVASASSITEISVEQDFGECCLEGFVYDKEALRELKDMAPGSTSFEAATAFIVRHVVRLSGDDDMAKFVLMVDFRARLSAATFAGNLALPKAVVIPRSDFVNGPLANSVAPVHEAVKGADDSYFRAFVAYAGRGPPSKERAMAVSSCARLSLYSVDFGYGSPCFAGVNPPVPRLVPHFLLFLPNVNKDDGFVVYLQLEKALMDKLLQDPEFSSMGSKYEPLSSEVQEEEEVLAKVDHTQHSRI